MEQKPTEGELDILRILWRLGESTVRVVNEELCVIKKMNVGYTTTLKLMQIMFEKDLLDRDDSCRSHIYKAKISEESTQTYFLEKFVDSFFSGSSSKLVIQALGQKNTTKEEITKIREYLNKIETEKK